MLQDQEAVVQMELGLVVPKLTLSWEVIWIESVECIPGSPKELRASESCDDAIAEV